MGRPFHYGINEHHRSSDRARRGQFFCEILLYSCCRSFMGKNISVKFDRLCALQIDGETISDVEEYSVEA